MDKPIPHDAQILDSSKLHTVCRGCNPAVEQQRHFPVRIPCRVVWCPKYRRRILGGRIEERLKELIREVVDEKGAWLVRMEVMPDHVHLLVEVDPQYGVHRLVKAIKGRSSRVLREEFPHLKSQLPTLWTNSYFVATVGGAPPAMVKRYVEQQKGR
ncbi:UNVERIFIED_ORG: putative transposase [Microbispora rosea subsp. rosea]